VLAAAPIAGLDYKLCPVGGREARCLTGRREGRGLTKLSDASATAADARSALRSVRKVARETSSATAVAVRLAEAQRDLAVLRAPVDGVVVSGLGRGWGRMHEGIDIAVSYGTPIRAAASGTVIHAGWLGGYGNLVVVDHGNGLATAYAHASAILVGVGQQVSQGETVSLVGSTGNSSGPHLHFEVRINGTAVNPGGYIRK